MATCPHFALEFDWRSAWGKDFLRGAVFRWEEYSAPGEVWDHDHCALCWQKFMELDHPEIERYGYVANWNGTQWWVCRAWFEDFREEYDWQFEPTGQ